MNPGVQLLLFVFGWALILPGGVQAADLPGSRDYPAFGRLPGFEIAEYAEEPAGSHSFADRRGEDRKVRGRKWVIRYELAPGAKPLQPNEIARRHGETARRAGGSVYEYTGHTFFLQWTEKGKEVWTEVYAGEDYYILTIVEKTGRAQIDQGAAASSTAALQAGASTRPSPGLQTEPPPSTPGMTTAPTVPGVTGTHAVPGLSGVPGTSPAGAGASHGTPTPGAMTTPAGDMVASARPPDLEVADLFQRYEYYWRAVSPSADMDVLLRNNGGDYTGPLRIHVRSYSVVPVPVEMTPIPESQKTFDYERVEIKAGHPKPIRLEQAIISSGTRWGCRRQVVVTLDPQVHNDANPANNIKGELFFEQNGLASDLSRIREVWLREESENSWMRLATEKTQRLRPGKYILRFVLLSCSRTEVEYYLDAGATGVWNKWVTLPAAGEVPVEIHLDFKENKKGFWLVQWWRPAFENWKDAKPLFKFYYDIR